MSVSPPCVPVHASFSPRSKSHAYSMSPVLGPQDPEVNTTGSFTEFSLVGDTDLDQRATQKQVK